MKGYKKNLTVVLFVLLISQLIGQQIPSISNFTPSDSDLQVFFDIKLDFNKDGTIDKYEWLQFLNMMDPHNEGGEEPEQEEIKLDQVQESFRQQDLNGDGVISWKEFELTHMQYRFSGREKGPTQVHLAMTNNTSEMHVTWITTKGHEVSNGYVYYGSQPDSLDQIAIAEKSTYNVGKFGFHGTIYQAVMTGLLPRQQYFYQVGSNASKKQLSRVFDFISPPQEGQTIPNEIHALMFGDHGTIIPYSSPVTRRMIQMNNKHRFDFSLLVGDIAYAGTGSEQQGQIEPIWNLYGAQIEPLSSRIPYMTGLGNHQKYNNYTSFKSRYTMPQRPGSQGNLWFSFTYGFVHIVHMSTEHDYHPGSAQYNFLENDLQKASENRNIKWIVFGGHRPMYSSDQSQWDSHRPGCQLLTNLEKLLLTYRVDIVMTGHMHCYERTFPVFNGQVQMGPGSTSQQYLNPQAPVYVVQGTAGALIREKWIQPQPEWSAVRVAHYGFGQAHFYVNGTFHYQYYHHQSNQVRDEFWIIQN